MFENHDDAPEATGPELPTNCANVHKIFLQFNLVKMKYFKPCYYKNDIFHPLNNDFKYKHNLGLIQPY